MFRDNYTDFSYNEIHSSNFKVWITNSGDLKRSMSPTFTDTFNVPTNGQIRYFEGTTIEKQDFTFNCVAVDVTLSEWRAICEWLSPLSSGKLRFDWNAYYYYMVKPSSNITGEMFIKNKIDPKLGELFIVKFTVNFTTVSDWAALGPYCEQEVLSETLSLNDSVFINPYCIPQILIKEDSTNNTKTIGSGIQARSKLILGRGEGKADNYLIRPVAQSSSELQLKYPYIKIEGTTVSYEYPGEEGLVNTVNFEVGDTIETSPNWVIVTTDGSNTNTNVEIKTDRSYCIANPSSYEMFPNFNLVGSTGEKCTIKKDNEVYYSFICNKRGEIYIDSRDGSMLSGCKIAETVLAADGSYLFSSIENKGQMSIKSGRPEMHKGYIVKTGPVQTDSMQNYIKIKVDTKLVYDRGQNYIVSFFEKNFLRGSNIYGVDDFGEKDYSTNLTTQSYLVLDSPVLYYAEEDGEKYIYVFTCYKNSSENGEPQFVDFANNYNFVKDKECYFSICDYEVIQIDASRATIGTYTRDVI